MTTLKIYKTKITMDKNAIVDNIPFYLSSLTPTYVNNDFQYQKIALHLSIKINATQDNVGSSIGNYVDVFQDNKHYYYFIEGNGTWIAKETLGLDLVLDTLNTFKNDYSFSNKTNVIREHRNRFLNTDRYTSGSYDLDLHFTVDETDEGIQPAIMVKKTSASKIQESGHADQNWYLVYETKSINNQSNPLEVYLYPKNNNVPYDNGYQSTITWTVNDMQTNVFYMFPNRNRAYKNDGQHNYILQYDIQVIRDGIIEFGEDLTTKTHITFTSPEYYYLAQDGDNIYSTVASHKYYIKAGQTGTAYLDNIDTVDRSYANLVKIIELPYLPANITWNNNVINLTNTGFEVVDNRLHLMNYTAEFERTLPSLELSPLNPQTFQVEPQNIFHTSRNDNMESKMLHSSLYQYKLNYDSFSSFVAFERLTRTSNTCPTLTMKYKPSNNLGSDMMFHWTFNNSAYKEIQDYDTFLSCSRNNELGLYTSAYLDYMRSGYNYDKKEKTRSLAKTWIGTGVTILGAVGAMVLTQGAATPVAAKVIAGAATSAIAIYNGINNTISTEQSFNKNISQLEAQAGSVQNASAVDLLNWYNGNKLWKIEYEPTAAMKKQLQDLFFYCGYATNQKKVPSPNNRYWFDYLQCEPVFTNEDTTTVYYDYLEDIKARYAVGVVYYHVHAGEYDWSQQYENFENSLFI